MIARSLAVVLAAAPALALAQGAPPAQQPPAPEVPSVAASSFAVAEVHFRGRFLYGGRWMSAVAGLEGPARLSISYGQPHARGRQILGGVVPYDSIWRLGANLPTKLTTEVDITLGGTRIPHGVYTLWTLPTKSGWTLIVNREVGQYGTPADYTPAADFARIPLKSRTLTDTAESLSIFLIPNVQPRGAPPANPSGILKIVWGTFELTTDWALAPWEKPKQQ